MTGPPSRPVDVPDKIVAALDRLGRGVRAQRQAIAARFGLSPLQLDLLQTLADAPPPQPLPGLLATELGVSQPTVTDSLLALERKGHVVRQRDPEDRRRTVTTLTPSGIRLVEQARDAQRVVRAGVAALPADDQVVVLSALIDLIGTLLEAGVIDVARTCTTCHFFERTVGDAGEVTRCGLLGVPLTRADLRVNCPEHQPRVEASSPAS